MTDPSVSVVSGDFDGVAFDGGNLGEAPGGYVFGSLSTTAFGTLTFNTVDGTFTFTIDRAAIVASGSAQTVTFSVTGTDGENDDEDSVTINLSDGGVVLLCVAKGTKIACGTGEVLVENLSIGDNIVTMDAGLQTIRWIGSRKINHNELAANPELKPIRIRKNALGENLPATDLLVSPQHRVVLDDWRAQMYFGEDEVLAPAKGLVNDSTIVVDHTATQVEYFHVMFDTHQIIITNGAPTESFCPGPYSLREIDQDARKELFQILPELENNFHAYGPAARLSLNMAETHLVAN